MTFEVVTSGMKILATVTISGYVQFKISTETKIKIIFHRYYLPPELTSDHTGTRSVEDRRLNKMFVCQGKTTAHRHKTF